MTQTYHVKGEKIDSKGYHYKQCGLDDVYLLNGFKMYNTPHGKGVTVHNVQDLHEVIAYNLCHNKALINNKEFRFLRKLMALTQAELASYFACDVQTVARWEKGETEINGAADRLVRLLCIAHICTKLPAMEIMPFINDVSNLDSKSNEDQVFKETKGEWKIAA